MLPTKVLVLLDFVRSALQHAGRFHFCLRFFVIFVSNTLCCNRFGDYQSVFETLATKAEVHKSKIALCKL